MFIQRQNDLEAAVHSGSFEEVKRLIKIFNPNANYCRSLRIACHNGQVDMVQFLIDNDTFPFQKCIDNAIKGNSKNSSDIVELITPHIVEKKFLRNQDIFQDDADKELLSSSDNYYRVKFDVLNENDLVLGKRLERLGKKVQWYPTEICSTCNTTYTKFSPDHDNVLNHKCKLTTRRGVPMKDPVGVVDRLADYIASMYDRL